MESFDVIVLGSGPAGGIIARKCSEAGLSVAVVERNGWGGVCPLRGCEPKKTLADVAHTVSRVRDLADHGVAGSVRLDWPALMRFKRSLIDPISNAVLDALKNRGITTIHGQGRLIGPDAVMVDGHGPLQGKHVVITVGAKPRPLDVPGEELVASSDEFLELDAMPGSLLFIGGGFVSFEFAALAAAAGAKATILHRSGRVLKGFDRDLAGTLIQAMADQGVIVLTDHPVSCVEQCGQEVRVTVAREGRESHFSADRVFHGAGRVPDLAALGLDAAGVEWTGDGVTVNARMQSVSNPRVFAAGDCAAPGLPLTPVAALQAEVVASNIITGSGTSDLTGTAGVVFTHPPLSVVGLLPEEAEEQGLQFEVHEGDAARWSEHKRLGLSHAGYKVLVEKGTGRILGAHYLGQHAEEVANVFGLAVRHNLTREDLLAQPWGYPSFGYALRYMLR